MQRCPRDDGVCVLRITGEFDAVSAQPLHDQVTALVGGEPLVLDLTRVTFFDSSGVRVVNRLARTHDERAGFRVVAPPGGRARRVLDIVGFGTGVVTDDVEQALAQLRSRTA